MAHRIIARLDIKGPNLVKGIHLEGLRVVGKPEAFAKYYFEQGIDELLYMDVVASLYERNSLEDIIRRTASEVFIPLTVGGGLRTVEDIRKALLAGADKVSINTAAVKDPSIIRRASRYFGSSTIVVSIEAIRHSDGRYYAYVDNGREATGKDVVDWARKVEDLGAGEIILTSVDREGTGTGYDLELTRRVADAVSIPVVASGGAGCPTDLVDAIQKGGADAVSVASILHYDAIRLQAGEADYSSEGNVEFLKKGIRFSKIQPTSIRDLKDALALGGLEVRSLQDGVS